MRPFCCECQIRHNNRNITLYFPTIGVCLNSGSHRNLIHLNITTESSARMTNTAVLVSFHNQYVCLIVSVSNVVCLYVCVSNFLCRNVCDHLCVPYFVCLF